MKRLIAFDLDGTLAQSKQAIDAEMAALLSRLLEVAQVAVISGGDWPQFEQQLVRGMLEASQFSRLFLLPTSGAKLYRYQRGWHCADAQMFSESERARIIAALTSAQIALNLNGDASWGEKIEDRGTQITFSGLGQQAPLEAKQRWDADFAKRRALQAHLIPLLPDFSVKIGGSTSIDITRLGVDKAFGIGKLAEASGIAVADMIFVGDALYPGGNDYVVLATGVAAIAVRDVEETKRVVETMICCLDGAQNAAR